MNCLTGKKVLFVAPVFYQYHKHIIDSLEKLGANVVFLPERQYSVFHNICYKSIRLRNWLQRLYFARSNVLLNDQFNYLFVIRGFGMPDSFVKKFKRMNPRSQTIMYQWDSAKVNSYIHLIPLFDRAFTFDPVDAKNIDIVYLPLFFCDEYRRIRTQDTIKKYDFLYIASFRKERYEMLLFFKEKLSHFSFCHYLYLPVRSYWKLKLSGYPIKKELINFSPLAESSVIQLLSQSHCVIDVSPSIQNGLPIRIFETLGAGVKLISTNSHIKKHFELFSAVECFDENYNFQNFLQLTGAIDFDKIEQYSLENWIKKIFICEDNCDIVT